MYDDRFLSQIPQAKGLSTPGAASSSGSVAAPARASSASGASPAAALQPLPAGAHQATSLEHASGLSILPGHAAGAGQLAAPAKGICPASGTVLPSGVRGPQPRLPGQGGDAAEAALAARESQHTAPAAEPVPAPVRDVRPASSTGTPLTASPSGALDTAAVGPQGQVEGALEACPAGRPNTSAGSPAGLLEGSLSLPAMAAAANAMSSDSAAAAGDSATWDTDPGVPQRSMQEAGLAFCAADVPANSSSSIHSGEVAVQCSTSGSSATARRAEVAAVPALLQDSSAQAGPPGSAMTVHGHSAPEERGLGKQRAVAGGLAHAAEPVLPAATAAAAEVAARQQGSRVSLTEVAEQPHLLEACGNSVNAQLSHEEATHLGAVKQVSPMLHCASLCWLIDCLEPT